MEAGLPRTVARVVGRVLITGAEGELLVGCGPVPTPVAVRYAFSMNPDKANLYNKEGLPAVPFRTDNENP